MLYIVSEDSTSGFQFWNEFNRVVLDGKAIVTHSGENGDKTGGKDKVVDKISNMALSNRDTVFIAIDFQDFRVVEYIETIRQDAEKRGYRGFYTPYACLEEVFLSFNMLIGWCQIEHTEKLLYSYEETFKAIQLGNDRFDLGSKNSAVRIFEEITGKIFNTKAQFYAKLLDSITNSSLDVNKRLRPWFHINKSRIRECWTHDCMYNEAYCNKCECRLIDQKLSGETKIELLQGNSILNRAEYSLMELVKFIEED